MSQKIKSASLAILGVMMLGACGATNVTSVSNSATSTSIAPTTSLESTTTTLPPPSRTSVVTTETAIAPSRAATTAAGCYIDPEGNCYHAGEYCPTKLRGQIVQGADGPIDCVDNNGWRWENA